MRNQHRQSPGGLRSKRHAAIDHDGLEALGSLSGRSGRCRISEEMRIAKRPLVRYAFRSDAELRDRVILITSSHSGEGKSFSSVNLAMSLASEESTRVLLIDADQTKCGAARLLGMPNEPGLTNLLTGDGHKFSETLITTDIPSLYFLPVGGCHDQVTELLASRRMAQLCRKLLEHDPNLIIVIDAPPVLEASEPSGCSAHAGQAVLVIEADKTSVQAIDEAIGQIEERIHLSLLLNKSRPTRLDSPYMMPTKAYDRISDAAESRSGNAGQRPMRSGAGGGRRTAAMIGLIAVMSGTVPFAFAALDFQPFLRVGLGFSDNISLAVEGQEEEGLRWSAGGGVNVKWESPRIRTDTQYSLDVITELDSFEDPEFRHDLVSQGDLTLLGKTLTLEWQANASTSTPSDEPETFSGLDLSPDRRLAGFASAGPVWRIPLGGFGFFEAKYSYGRGFDEDNRVPDSEVQRASAIVEKPSRLSFWGHRAGLEAEWIDLEPTAVETSRELARYRGFGEVDIPLSTSTNLFLGAGFSLIEDSRGAGSEEGFDWNIGLNSRLTSNIVADLAVGQEFGDEFASANLTYQWRPQSFVSLGLDYAVENTARIVANSEADDILLGPDNLSDNQLASEFFEREAIRLAVSQLSGRNEWDAFAYFENRRFDNATLDSSLYGAGFSASRKVSPRNTAFVQGTLDHVVSSDGAGEEDDIWGLLVGWSHQLSPSTSIDTTYEHTRRDAEDAQRDITANSVFVRLRKDL